ncbi:hypothetical protein AB0D10_00285 [Kitasatospora sp. NPDC048545]|uniref:hypothetical protein n=1 Tax=Kitasatospora sp. NPDC048545 TaxID=3157208 RepID=UPI0033C92B9A
MTAIADRMTGIFENLEVPEGVKAELIRGEIVMTAGPDMVHNLIVSAIQHQSLRDPAPDPLRTVAGAADPGSSPARPANPSRIRSSSSGVSSRRRAVCCPPPR